MSEGHYHTVEMDEMGNGVTTYASHMKNHAHKIVGGVVMEAEGHTHDITMSGVPVHNMEEGEVINERPMSPTEEEAMSNSKSEEVVAEKTSLEEAIVDGGHSVEEKSETTEVIADAEVEETEEKTVEATEEKAVTEESEVKANAEEAIEDEMEKDDSEEDEFVARDPNESIPFVNLLSADANSLQNGDLVNYNEKMYKVAKIATAQSPIYKFLEVDAEGNDCDNVLNVNADDLSQSNQIQKSEDTVSNESLTNELHDHSTKENDNMADQVVDTIDLDTVAKEANIEVKKRSYTCS
jgi:hypothetical protein